LPENRARCCAHWRHERRAFLDIYVKNAKDDLTSADKHDIREAINEIRTALRP
jgi:hypothetical protein